MSWWQEMLTGEKTSAGRVVGVDIGSSSIKVVELEDRQGVITLLTYGEMQLGPYVDSEIGKSVALDQSKEQQALVDTLRESAVGAKQAVFSVPLSSSFVTNVVVSAPSEADLGAMVRLEARKVIPASLSEVTLDWAEVGIQKDEQDTNSAKHNVLIAAIQNSALDRFKLLMQFVGLKQPVTEIECFSVVRSVYRSDEPNIAVVDIGAVSAKLYIVSKGLLVRMYRVRAGGALATEAIAKALEVNFQQAEDLKYSLGKDDQRFPVMRKAHNQSYERAFREFRQVISDYEQKNDTKISLVYLTGGGSLFPGIDAGLQAALVSPVILANPFSKVAYPAFMEDTLVDIGPSFAVALGAALRALE